MCLNIVNKSYFDYNKDSTAGVLPIMTITQCPVKLHSFTVKGDYTEMAREDTLWVVYDVSLSNVANPGGMFTSHMLQDQLKEEENPQRT